MLFIVAMSFARDMLAQLLSWSYAPFSVLAVYSFARSRWGRLRRSQPRQSYFFVPIVSILATITSVDLAVMFYGFLSVYALLQWVVLPRMHWFSLAAILCGLAVGTKYTAIPVAWFILEMFIFWHTFLGQRRSFLESLKQCAVFGLIVGGCLAPWGIKNWIYTGNPLYPFFDTWFPR